MNKNMSANDYLLLTREGEKYVLSHRDADTNLDFERWEFDELEEALAKAEEEQDLVEYGLRLKLEKRGNKWKKIKFEEINGPTFSRWWEEGEKGLRDFIQSLVEKKGVK